MNRTALGSFSCGIMSARPLFHELLLFEKNIDENSIQVVTNTDLFNMPRGIGKSTNFNLEVKSKPKAEAEVKASVTRPRSRLWF